MTIMDDKFPSELEELCSAVLNYEALSKKSLGFFETITYKDVLFNVSFDLVIADLSPLAFLNLVEHIDTDGAEGAAIRLYERILPLLSCTHHWIEPTRPLDQDGGPMMDWPLKVCGDVLVCEFCVAYAMQNPGTDLPVIGRFI
jgi:hypothetical protein